ncbi:hypothetical protein K503DRAFT_805107 [Rhizopogon vinicolor AM-OR11-026]|uniref:Uncharacterized protein n=1 Tax=Rhizopogon vinicolor AM-OR11-026 TaxID=1314800 RepID=A0A1B7MJ10_9AGAM|nr:hypothetical protein K503DRAFT_805107 [Rhizopogon vinicolor AM-OR11-026]
MLQTQDGEDWLQTQDGQDWLQTRDGRGWIQTWSGRDWLQTQSGRVWMQTNDGRDWLQTKDGRDWLQIQGGQDWLQTQGGRDWLQIQDGQDWLQTQEGQSWLQTQNGLEWLPTPGGRDWLLTRGGRDWLRTKHGREWLCTTWLRTQGGHDWLQTQDGQIWLQTRNGEDWLQTSHGRAWQSTPAASVRVTMAEFSGTLEEMDRHTLTAVPELSSQPVFQVIQQFKSLPDFLMFPAFLALRHQDHSTSALPQSHFRPDREIIHAMTAFMDFANEAQERSRSTSDALKYACQNWAVHLSRAPSPWHDELLNPIFMAFWNRYLLSWLERQWCLKGLRSCLVILSEGQKLAKEYLFVPTKKRKASSKVIASASSSSKKARH